MEKIGLLFILSIISICGFANDKIYFHNGKTIEGKVTEVGESTIKFSYSGEDLINTVSKKAIEKIEFENGRTENISDKIIVEGEKDWEKVVITYDKNEVIGLVSLGETTKKSNAYTSLGFSQGHFTEKAKNKVKKEAAKSGGCIVLIVDQSGNSTGYYRPGNATITAEIYKY